MLHGRYIKMMLWYEIRVENNGYSENSICKFGVLLVHWSKECLIELLSIF